MDCVDLSHGFFLTRFSLKEDYEASLKRGPWFIGEHFLSIRPWEPDFFTDDSKCFFSGSVDKVERTLDRILPCRGLASDMQSDWKRVEGGHTYDL